MRLHIADNDFEGEGFSETSTPHIADKNNAKIFYMLTSGFYSRPRESMFREICANALDEARHASRPFAVMLPHAMQPELVIRDWGRGMTHPFVMQRAMSLGDSTKDHDDNAIGGFGLGMKTPFCVTEQFSLVAYRGDHKQTYVIDRKQGTPRPMTSPEMIEALEGDDQCTGIELRIPIPEKDWREFREIASRILQLFPADSFELHGAHCSPPEYVREAESYAILKESSAPTYARMGCIAYRLDLEAIYGDAWQELGAPSTGMELRFPIGALSVTPNREALLMDDRTRDAVKAALGAALEDFKAEFAAHIQTAPTQWAAMHLFARAHFESGDASRFLPKSVQWQNAERGAIISGIETPRALTAWACSDLQRYKSPRPIERDAMTWKPESVNRHRAPPVWVWVLDDIEPGTHKKLIERARLALRHAWNNLGQRNATRVAIIDAAFVEAVGMAAGDYLLASDFEPPKPERAARGSGYLKGKIRAYCSAQYSGRTSSRWGLREVSLEAGGYYIPFKGSHAVNAYAHKLARLSGIAGLVWGMPQNLTKQLDPAKWINLETEARKRASRIINSPLLARSLVWDRVENASHGAGYSARALFQLLLKYRPACPEFGALKDKIQKLKPQAKLSKGDMEALETIASAGVLTNELQAKLDAIRSAPLPFDIEAELGAYLKARPIFSDLIQNHEHYARRGLMTEFFRAAEIVRKEKP